METWRWSTEKLRRKYLIIVPPRLPLPSGSETALGRRPKGGVIIPLWQRRTEGDFHCPRMTTPKIAKNRLTLFILVTKVDDDFLHRSGSHFRVDLTVDFDHRGDITAPKTGCGLEAEISVLRSIPLFDLEFP